MFKFQKISHNEQVLALDQSGLRRFADQNRLQTPAPSQHVPGLERDLDGGQRRPGLHRGRGLEGVLLQDRQVHALLHEDVLRRRQQSAADLRQC